MSFYFEYKTEFKQKKHNVLITLFCFMGWVSCFSGLTYNYIWAINKAYICGIKAKPHKLKIRTLLERKKKLKNNYINFFLVQWQHLKKNVSPMGNI